MADDEQEMREFYNYLSCTKGLMDRTVILYLGYFKIFDIARISSQEYCNQFVQDHKNNSVVRGMLINLLQFKGLSKSIDMPPKKTGSVKKRIIRDISKEEIDKLKDYLYKQSFKKGLIFELIYQGALRRVEIPTVKMNSFKWLEWINDVSKPCHLIILGKRDKERTVLINPETVEKIFMYYMNKYQFKSMDDFKTFANSNSLLFPNLSEYKIYDIIHRGSINCLNRDIRTHELRHCRATELEKMGVPIKDIKVYLGHSNLATTEIYLHTSEKESIRNIQDILNKREKEDASD
jgi:integrase